MEGAIDNAPTLLERLTGSALHAITSGDSVSPRILRFLLRSYAVSGRTDIGDALGVALAASLSQSAADDSNERQVEWARLFLEATSLSDDERMLRAADETIDRLRRSWSAEPDILRLARSLDVVMRGIEQREASSGDLLAEAVDRLEALIAHGYRPGGGLIRPGSAAEAARLADQIAAGTALASAYRITGRLPYAMLAEELLQFTRRTWWNAERARFEDASPDNFVVNCEAIQLFGALGALHGDEDYRSTAVFTADANYLADAEHLLAALGRVVLGHDHESAAAYGIALRDWLR